MPPEHSGKRQSEGFADRERSVHYHFPALLESEAERRLKNNRANYKQTKKANKIWCLTIPGRPIKIGTDMAEPTDPKGEHKWFGKSVKNSFDMSGCQRFFKVDLFWPGKILCIFVVPALRSKD